MSEEARLEFQSDARHGGFLPPKRVNQDIGVGNDHRQRLRRSLAAAPCAPSDGEQDSRGNKPAAAGPALRPWRVNHGKDRGVDPPDPARGDMPGH